MKYDAYLFSRKVTLQYVDWVFIQPMDNHGDGAFHLEDVNAIACFSCSKIGLFFLFRKLRSFIEINSIHFSRYEFFIFICFEIEKHGILLEEQSGWQQI